MTPELTDVVASVQTEKYLKGVLRIGKIAFTDSFKHVCIYTFNRSQLPASVAMT